MPGPLKGSLHFLGGASPPCLENFCKDTERGFQMKQVWLPLPLTLFLKLRITPEGRKVQSGVPCMSAASLGSPFVHLELCSGPSRFPHGYTRRERFLLAASPNAQRTLSAVLQL